MGSVFTKDFLDWIDEDGFYVKDTWNPKENKWGGKGNVYLFPFQRRILQHVLTLREDGKFPYTTVLYSTTKKSGKGLELDTPIPTPSGWTTMGQLQQGDEVFDEQGKPCKVTFATEVMYDHPCYRVSFSDGTSVIADGEHQWYVGSRLQPDKSCKKGESNFYWHVTTTDVMVNRVTIKNGGKLTRNYSIQMAKPLQYSEKDLPIPPYTLGVWLGDGDADNASITKSDRDGEILDYIRDEGVPIKARKIQPGKAPQYGLTDGHIGKPEEKQASVQYKLRMLDLLGNKHIPEIYLQASVEQRLTLLRGLMDTDGYISTDCKECEYTTVSEKLAKGVLELVRGLGFKARIHVGKAMLNGRFISMKYRIQFYALSDFSPFWLKRKAEKLKNREHLHHRSEYIRITAIEPVPSVPVRCIQVDSPSSLYLFGEGVTPTHNTALAGCVTSWYAETAPEGTEIYICANSKEQAAGRVMVDVKYHFAHADRDDMPKVNQWDIKFRNGTLVQALSQSFSANAGSRHALVTFDELWGASTEGDRRMWDEMTPIPTIPYSLRFITTYAGFMNESDLLWELYLQGVGDTEHPDGKGKPVPELADITDSMGNPVCFSNGGLFVYWNHEPTMPWQDEEYYSSQAVSLRPSAYLRLHENRWVTTHEAYIPIEWWDRAVNPDWKQADLWAEHPFRWSQIFVGVDASSKRDSTAVVGVGYDAKRGEVGLAFHKIWIPREQELFDHETTVEKYIREKKAQGFRIAEIVYDPAHFVQTANRLRVSGFKMTEYTQSVSNMTIASQKLYDLMKSKAIRVYPSDELRTHILNCVAQEETRGFRIVKQKDAGRVWKPIDAAIALAMACYRAVESGGVDFSTPTIIQSPFSDVTAWKHNTGQQFGWPFDP